jgi:hypothetical protein
MLSRSRSRRCSIFALLALNGQQFLVLERNNRGIGDILIGELRLIMR